MLSARFRAPPVAALAMLVAAGMAVPSSARAGIGAGYDWSNWYVPFGLKLGVAFEARDIHAFLLGGELSVVRVFRRNGGYWFAGGVADYDHGYGTGIDRVSLGLEGGRTNVGIDASYVRQLGGGPASALRLRAFAYLLLVSFYIGQTVVLGDTETRTFTELGALLKFPLCIPTDGTCQWGIPLWGGLAP